MTDKLALAEEILFRYRLKSSGMTEKDMIEAIQAYHEAKMKEITDGDIEAYLDAHEVDDPILRKALRIGAKAMRDGEIKHNG